jgi:hypothetical protein
LQIEQWRIGGRKAPMRRFPNRKLHAPFRLALSYRETQECQAGGKPPAFSFARTARLSGPRSG